MLLLQRFGCPPLAHQTQVNAQAAARILAEQAGLDVSEEGGKKKKKAAAAGVPTLLEASRGVAAGSVPAGAAAAACQLERATLGRLIAWR